MAGLIDADGGLDFGTGLAWLTSGIGQAGLVITTSTSGAALFLAEYGPYGMVMDFDDASIAIANSDGSLNYQSQGDFSSAGAPLGPLSKLTYTAPSVKLTEQADGNLAFQAHNLFQYSEAHGTSPWLTSTGGVGLAPTRTNNYAPGPAGAMQATRIQFSLNGGTTFSDISAIHQTVAMLAGATYARDVWIKSTDGSSSYTLQVQAADGLATNVTVTGSWQKFTVTAVASGTINLSIRLRGANGNSNTADVLVSGDHLRRTPSASDYIATTSAAAYDLPYVYSSGVRTGIMVEPAATNVCLYARDLTNAAWTKTGATAALTATGVDGVANSASTLTASSSNGTAVQNISSASAARSMAVYLKRRTGTGTVTISHGATTGSTLVTNGTFASDVTGWTAHNSASVTFATGTLQVQEAGNPNPVAYQAVTVTAGKLYKLTGTATMTSGTGTARVTVYDTPPLTTLMGTAIMTTGASATGSVVFRASDTQVSVVLLATSASAGATATFDNIELIEVAETDVTSSINASTWTRVSILNETITNPAVCIKLATSGDAVDVDIAGSETGTVATSPIITYGAAVLRASDAPDALLNLFPAIGTAYTIYAKYKPQSASVATTALQLDDTTANELVRLDNKTSGQGRLTVVDGGVTQAAPESSVVSSAAFNRLAASIEANNVRIVVNGGSAVQDTSVTLPTLTRLLIGGAGGMELQQLAILPGARTEAQLQALGA